MGGEGFGPHDERESLKVLHTASEQNLRHFDTAGFYGHGKSEELLSHIIKSDREEYFISSKGGLVWEGRKVAHRASPENLKNQLYESLERLGTDYLDLYQLHWPDPNVPVSESIDALKELKKSGIIRSWGAGNLSEFDIYTYLGGQGNIPHQVHFNPIHRNFAVLHSGEKECINCVTSHFEQVLLLRGQPMAGQEGIGKNDFRNRNPYFSDLKVLVWRKKLNELLLRCPIPKTSVILMWICCQPHVHAVIPGPRKPAQLDEIIRFRKEVEQYGLLSSNDDTSILSREKTSEVVPEDIWNRLSKGP